jgi:hypothetical protein
LVAPGGVLVLELPCLDKVLALFDHFIKQKQPVPVNLTLWGLYGDPKYRSDKMVHRWCYSVAELTDMLESLGCAVTEEKPQTHQPVRDMRLVARKV